MCKFQKRICILDLIMPEDEDLFLQSQEESTNQKKKASIKYYDAVKAFTARVLY